MSPTTHRSLALAGILVTAALAAPALAQAQSITGEQLLLNRLAPAVGLDQRVAVAPTAAEATPTESIVRIDGATAMLGRNVASTVRPLQSGTTATLTAPQTRINGEQALLGHVAAARSRHEGGD